MTDYVIRVRNIRAADDAEEEENGSSSYELTRALAAANMTMGCLPPKMVLRGTENRMPLLVWAEKRLPIYEQISSRCYLKCCKVCE